MRSTFLRANERVCNERASEIAEGQVTIRNYTLRYSEMAHHNPYSPVSPYDQWERLEPYLHSAIRRNAQPSMRTACVDARQKTEVRKAKQAGAFSRLRAGNIAQKLGHTEAE